jgi:hypothetical protein
MHGHTDIGRHKAKHSLAVTGLLGDIGQETCRNAERIELLRNSRVPASIIGGLLSFTLLSPGWSLHSGQ